MKEIITDRFLIKIEDFELNKVVSCPFTCGLSENGFPKSQYSCAGNIKNLLDDNKIKLTTIKLLIKNISSELISVNRNRFDIIDSLGFIYSPITPCSYISELVTDKRVKTGSCELPPNTQIYFNLYTEPFDVNTQLSKVHYTDGRICHTIDLLEMPKNIVTAEEKIKIDEYKLNEEFKDSENTRIGKSAESLLNYKIEEDDECLYLISEEKDAFVTFSRRFDLNKSNYNWVNKGEPLISLFFDEDNGFKLAQHQLDSPETGVFEYEKKRFIAYNEVICRIRKFKISEKDEVLRELEKKAIKEILLKKEQKKLLEREALDELIADGLIFNTYIDKMGNRNKIPSEVANAVWNRDGGKCSYCGGKENLEFDHIIPVSKGGATTFQNLQLLCKTCNIRK